MVLLAGLGIACITAFIEYLWTNREARRIKKVKSFVNIYNCVHALLELMDTGMHKSICESWSTDR